MTNEAHAIEQAARWLGIVTYTANHRPEAPHRDSEASRHSVRQAPRPRARQRRAVDARPVALGGHSLVRSGNGWRCTTCKRSSAKWARLAPAQCAGSAALRWARQAESMAACGGSDGGGHHRVLSGDVLWCSLCGSFAVTRARGLAQPCPGKVLTAGFRSQLRSLIAGKHPVSGAPLGEACPEPRFDVSAPCLPCVRPSAETHAQQQLRQTQLWRGALAHKRSAESMTQCQNGAEERLAAISARIQAKEAALPLGEAHGAFATPAVGNKRFARGPI